MAKYFYKISENEHDMISKYCTTSSSFISNIIYSESNRQNKLIAAVIYILFTTAKDKGLKI